jgi:hypothetical protein
VKNKQTDTNKSRKAARERIRRSKEKYYGKLALAATWESYDKIYYRKLKSEASKLREALVIKGAL